MAEVRLERVGKEYYSKKKKVPAVNGIDLCCRDGEFMVFLGPSGCGKTTTMRMIAGLESATAGEIRIGGRKVNSIEPGKRNVALAFENYALYPPLTAKENIVFPLRASKRGRDEIESRLAEIASLLELEEVLGRKPAQLSGGQQQMVSLARCLIRDADVYLMDEPLSHLDSDQRFKIRTRLKALHKKTKRTIIYVTHDQMEGMALADRIAVMNAGRLQQIDTPDAIYSQPKNTFVAGFVGEPPMNFLSGSLLGEGQALSFRSEDNSLSLTVRPRLFRSPQNIRGGRPLMIGIRPEDISTMAGSPEGSFPMTVEVYESLGEEGVLEMSRGQNVLTILSKPGASFRNGQTLNVCLDLDKIILFEPQTGERL
ncbi:MAG: ABC transporter ATP-binding protein [Acidobacteriota bacterium]